MSPPSGSINKHNILIYLLKHFHSKSFRVFFPGAKFPIKGKIQIIYDKTKDIKGSDKCKSLSTE